MYDRQVLIEGLKVPETATVIGCGGTGFWTAVFLAMSGVNQLILIDDDTIDITNLNRLPINRYKVSQSKVDVLEKFIISDLGRNPRLELHKVKIAVEEDCQLIRGKAFCCTDSLRSQQLILAYCRKNNIPYQRVGYDGTILNVSRSFPMTFKADVEDGYTVTPSWVAPAVMAAAAGVASQLYKDIVIMDDLSAITTAKSTHIPTSLRDKVLEENKEALFEENLSYIRENFYDYFDEHGYCPECNHDGYGYCEDCERQDCNYCDIRADYENGELSRCGDCDNLSTDEAEALEQERYLEALDDIFDFVGFDITPSSRVPKGDRHIMQRCEEVRDAIKKYIDERVEIILSERSKTNVSA